MRSMHVGCRSRGTADAGPRSLVYCPPVKLSVVIPAHDEVDSIAETVWRTAEELNSAGIDHEILVVDDASTDGTAAAVEEIAACNPRVRCIRWSPSPGFGSAVRAGLVHYTGEAVAIMMADLSDSPSDLVLYYRMLEQGYDCAFGTRFGNGGRAHDYPRVKLVMNRIGNTLIRLLFRHGYNDTTNAFKAYRRYVIDQIQPLFSDHFNLTVEMPLKAIIRGYNFAVVPVSWSNRQHGASKLKPLEMSGRYAFIVVYLWLEAHLRRGDQRRPDLTEPARWRQQAVAPIFGQSAPPTEEALASSVTDRDV
jgi:dolichol-phosphate mannosyltransferase